MKYEDCIWDFNTSNKSKTYMEKYKTATCFSAIFTYTTVNGSVLLSKREHPVLLLK